MYLNWFLKVLEYVLMMCALYAYLLANVYLSLLLVSVVGAVSMLMLRFIL